MDHTLVAIKRLCRTDCVVFTAKAEIEMDRDGLTREDIIEAILNAQEISKRLRSTNPLSGRRETLYVIEATNWDGILIYTKGKLTHDPDGDRYYVLVSSKASEP